MATGAQCIPDTTDRGAGTPALMMDVSPAMSAWLVNVRVITWDCQGCAEIVTDRKLAGSRCSAAVRTGSQAASALATIRTVPWDSWISVTPSSATSRPGSGAGRIVPADAPGTRPPRSWSGVRGAGEHGLPHGLRLSRRLKSARDTDPAGPQRCLRLVQRRRQLREVNRPRSWRRAELVDEPPRERKRTSAERDGRRRDRLGTGPRGYRLRRRRAATHEQHSCRRGGDPRPHGVVSPFPRSDARHTDSGSAGHVQALDSLAAPSQSKAILSA